MSQATLKSDDTISKFRVVRRDGAASAAAAAVDLAYGAGGGSSIYAACPLERCDVHTLFPAHIDASLEL